MEDLGHTAKCDFVGMGRGSLADPYLPNKAKDGKLTDIRYCVRCLQECIGKASIGETCTCLVNPSLGQEYRIDYSKVTTPKKIAVIGGGPAGIGNQGKLCSGRNAKR